MRAQRHTKALGFMLLSACMFAAVLVSSAAAAGGHWYINGTKLAEGTKKNIEGTATATAQLKYTFAGVAVNITCKKADTTAGVENPVGGLQGTTASSTLTLTECTVDAEEVTGCMVKNSGGTSGTIVISGVIAEVLTSSTIQVEPFSGTQLVTLVIEGCSNGLLNTSLALSGHANGVQNATNEIEFTETSGSSLTVGVHAAKFIGKFKFWEDGSSESASKVVRIGV
jgi:hypothetical protein